MTPERATALAREISVVIDGVAAMRAAARKTLPWKRIHEAADTFEPKILAHFKKAFDAGRKKVKPGTLRTLLPLGHKALETAMDRAVTVMSETASAGLAALLLETLNAGGAAGAKNLNFKLRVSEAQIRAAKPGQPDPKVGFRFESDSPSAAAWAKEHAAELVEGVTKTTRDNIREAIAAALEGDIDIEEAIAFIAEAVGDEARAAVIGRTESMQAVSAGQRETWSQAVDEGLLPATAKKVWIITPLEACPLCEELDGVEVGIDDDYDDEGTEGPPLHPNCRCTEGIVG